MLRDSVRSPSSAASSRYGADASGDEMAASHPASAPPRRDGSNASEQRSLPAGSTSAHTLNAQKSSTRSTAAVKESGAATSRDTSPLKHRLDTLFLEQHHPHRSPRSGADGSYGDTVTAATAAAVLGATVENDTLSSSTRNALSTVPTSSTISTVATSTSALVMVATAPQAQPSPQQSQLSMSPASARAVPQPPPVLSPSQVAQLRRSPSPPLLPAQSTRGATSTTTDSHAAAAATAGGGGVDGASEKPTVAPVRVLRSPAAALPALATYRSVPVLPPQVFRSPSGTNTRNSGAPASAAETSHGGAVNSTVSSPVLSPSQQSWLTATPSHSSRATGMGGGSAGGPVGSPLHGTASNSTTAAAGAALLMATPTAAAALSASTPQYPTARMPFSPGGSRRRNSVSVPTRSALTSEDDDHLNMYVEDGYPSTEQWLMLSPGSCAAVGHNGAASTAVTSRSSSRDYPPQPTVSPTDACSCGTEGCRGAASGQPPSAWLLVRPQSRPDPKAARSSPTATTTTTFSAVPDPPPIPTQGRSRDHSLALSLRSPLQSPPTAHVAATGSAAHPRPATATAGSSQRESLTALRFATHDPYSAAVISPAGVSVSAGGGGMHRTGSLSSLRSRSATLLTPTGPGSSLNSNTARSHVVPVESGAISSTGGAGWTHVDGGSVVLSPPYLTLPAEPPNARVSGSETLAGSDPPSSGLDGGAVGPYSIPPYLQQQQHQQWGSLRPRSDGGHSLPQPVAAQAGTHAFAPRRRTAQEVLAGFYSEATIELGEHTHLALDRNGMPYQGLPGDAPPPTSVPPPPPPSSTPQYPLRHPQNAYDLASPSPASLGAVSGAGGGGHYQHHSFHPQASQPQLAGAAPTRSVIYQQAPSYAEMPPRMQESAHGPYGPTFEANSDGELTRLQSTSAYSFPSLSTFAPPMPPQQLQQQQGGGGGEGPTVPANAAMTFLTVPPAGTPSSPAPSAYSPPSSYAGMSATRSPNNNNHGRCGRDGGGEYGPSGNVTASSALCESDAYYPDVDAQAAGPAVYRCASNTSLSQRLYPMDSTLYGPGPSVLPEHHSGSSTTSTQHASAFGGPPRVHGLSSAGILVKDDSQRRGTVLNAAPPPPRSAASSRSVGPPLAQSYGNTQTRDAHVKPASFFPPVQQQQQRLEADQSRNSVCVNNVGVDGTGNRPAQHTVPITPSNRAVLNNSSRSATSTMPQGGVDSVLSAYQFPSSSQQQQPPWSSGQRGRGRSGVGGVGNCSRNGQGVLPLMYEAQPGVRGGFGGLPQRGNDG